MHNHIVILRLFKCIFFNGGLNTLLWNLGVKGLKRILHLKVTKIKDQNFRTIVAFCKGKYLLVFYYYFFFASSSYNSEPIKSVKKSYLSGKSPFIGESIHLIIGGHLILKVSDIEIVIHLTTCSILHYKITADIFIPLPVHCVIACKDVFPQVTPTEGWHARSATNQTL